MSHVVAFEVAAAAVVVVQEVKTAFWLSERSEIKRLSEDSMFKLEHELQDKSKIVKLMPTLRELEEAKSDWKDDYSLNSMMRDALRVREDAISRLERS